MAKVILNNQMTPEPGIPSMPINKWMDELNLEARAILSFWAAHSPDPADEGFYGEIDHDNRPVNKALKSSVLNARLLWSFAKGHELDGGSGYLQLADRAFTFFCKHFKDPQHGGAYWYLQPPGQLADLSAATAPAAGTKKQIYAQAFWIYALSAYYKVSQNIKALQEAQNLFSLIETHSFDQLAGGYVEALTEQWAPIDDWRLSDKDVNCAKTMNTHLHLIEGYTELYQVWPGPQVEQKIRHLLDCFDGHFIDPVTGHLLLYFDRDFKIIPDQKTFSFGHDIEAAWLLVEAAKTIHDNNYTQKMRYHCLRLAQAAMQGLDPQNGALNYERQLGPDKQVMVQEKHWWVQAEALVGLLEACIQSGDIKFYNQARAVWQFICQQLKIPTGEWEWGLDAQNRPMTGCYKAGFWKGPYHSVRALLETKKRLQIISTERQFLV